MSAVSDALAEVVASIATMAPQHEGFRDLARLNISASAMREVQFSIDQYDRRLAFLEAAKLTLEQLIADGHPELAPRPIQGAELEDLQNQAETIAAALAQLTAGGAAAMRFSGGTPTPKA